MLKLGPKIGATECPFECGGGVQWLFGQCPNEQRYFYVGASLRLAHRFILIFSIFFISPQSERSEQGGFLFIPAGLSGYCCACGRVYCWTIIVIFISWVPYRGSSEMSQIHVQRWHFWTLVGYCWFWWYFITKVWSVHSTNIVFFISWVPYRGLRKCHKFGCTFSESGDSGQYGNSGESVSQIHHQQQM